MQPETLEMLCNPYTGEPFKRVGETLVGIGSGQVYPIRNGIPVILNHPSLQGRNRYYRWLYDRVAFAYDSIIATGSRLKVGTEQKIRQSYIQALDIIPGAKVLETAIGTANNLPHLPENIQYYGQDISWGMLRRAQRRAKRLGRQVELFQGDGAYLPFRDQSFDLVLHMGGLQFYSDPFRGVSHMARVARSGTTIHILDEARAAMRILKRMPAHAKYSGDIEMAVGALGRLVPHNMQAVHSQILPGGEFFALTFQKP